MRILVDADACPVKEIIVRLAKQRGIPVTGWLTYIPVCAFETNSIFYVSCVLEWEDELRVLLADNQVTDVVPRLNDFA